jgi:gluconolactonase
LIAPNDLAFGPDGRLYFTDPAQPFDPAAPAPAGRLFALGAGAARGEQAAGREQQAAGRGEQAAGRGVQAAGRGEQGAARRNHGDGPAAAPASELVADVGGVYCNGIGFTGDGRLLWVESYTRRVCTLEEGDRRVLATLPPGHVPDGFAVATDGRIFIASCQSHGISVLAADGRYLGLIPLDADANPTNCCFHGSALWVTDFGMDWATRSGAGRLWRIETDAVGAPGFPGSLGGL